MSTQSPSVSINSASILYSSSAEAFFHWPNSQDLPPQVGEQIKSDQLVEAQSRDYANQLKKFMLRASNRSERSFS